MLTKVFTFLQINTVKGRLRLSLGIVFLLLGLVSITTIYLLDRVNHEQKTYETLEHTIELKKMVLETWLNEQRSEISRISKLPSMRSQNLERIAGSFEAFTTQSSFYAFVFVNKDGITTVDSDTPPGIDVSDREYFIAAKNGREFVSDVLVGRATNTLAIIISAPVYDYENNFQGAVFGALSLEKLDLFMNMFEGELYETYIVDKEGFMLSSLYRDVKVDTYIYDMAKSYLPVKQVYENNNDIEVFGAYAWIFDGKWLMVAEIEKNKVLASLYRNLLVLTLIFLITYIIVGYIILQITKQIENPISNLIDGSRKIREKNYHYRMNVSDVNRMSVEFQELCYTYNEMAATIATHMELLEESKEQYRSVVDNVKEVIFEIDLAGNVKFLNFSWEKMTGFSVLESLKKKIANFVYEHDKEIFLDDIQKLMSAEKEDTRYEIRFMTKSGDFIWVEIFALLSYDQDGKKTGILGTLTDITERKEVSENLLKISNAMENATDGVGITDLESGKVIYANKSLINMFGYSLEEINQLGGGTSLYVNKELGKEVFSNLEQGIAWQGEVEMYHKDNHKLWVFVRANFVKNKDGKIISLMGIHTDITERRKTEQELLKARDEAVHASKAKSEFLSTMSHEIRTPLNAIIGMAELLEATPLTNEQEQYVKIYKKSSKSLLAILNSILDLSKIEAGEMELFEEVFELQELIEQTVELFTISAESKNIQLSYYIDKELPSFIRGDYNRIKQILINLLSNSIKFTHEGSVAVRVECNTTSHSGNLLFSVTDTGIGIPLDKIEYIFKDFVQVDNSISRKFGGTGLGLTIVKSLVTLMNGEVWIESELEKGTTFYFSIQCKCGENLNTTAYEKPEEEKSNKEITRRIRLLLVEDSVDNQFLIKAFLKNTNVEIDVAENGREAIEKFPKKKYDIVLMDIQMPEVDGYTATKAIREWEENNNVRNKTPIIALTAHALKEDVERSFLAGCNDHVTKPIKKSILEQILAKYT